MRKIFYLFALVLPFVLVSCADNSDEPDPVVPPAKLDPVTADNVVGNWQVYYATKLIKVKVQATNEPIREVSYDGYSILIEKVSNDSVTYKEFNANQKMTADGGAVFVGDTIMKFSGKVWTGAHENSDTTMLIRPYIVKANQYMRITSLYSGYTEYPKGTLVQKFSVTDRKFFRNQLNSASEGKYPDVPIKTLVDNSFLTDGSGKWRITKYSKTCRDLYTNDLEYVPEGDEGVGSEYWFGASEADSQTYRSWNSNGVESQGGTYRIYDDIIDFFYIYKGEEDASSLQVISKVTSASPNTFSEETQNYRQLEGRMKLYTKITTFERLP